MSRNRESQTVLVAIFVIALLSGTVIAQEATNHPAWAKGSYAEVLWNRYWYLATIIDIENDGYRVHYIGWEDKWDETVAKDRVRDGSYKVGDMLEVEWKGRYYPARILEVEANQASPALQRYKITYPGWSSSWEEWVTARRMRRAK